MQRRSSALCSFVESKNRSGSMSGEQAREPRVQPHLRVRVLVQLSYWIEHPAGREPSHTAAELQQKRFSILRMHTEHVHCPLHRPTTFDVSWAGRGAAERPGQAAYSALFCAHVCNGWSERLDISVNVEHRNRKQHVYNHKLDRQGSLFCRWGYPLA
jgi:hypothetical protein